MSVSRVFLLALAISVILAAAHFQQFTTKFQNDTLLNSIAYLAGSLFGIPLIALIGYGIYLGWKRLSRTQ